MNRFMSDAEKVLDMSMLAMAIDVHAAAAIIAPKDKRILVKSGRFEKVEPFVYRVVFGNDRVPYAKRRHYENKLHPETLLYLERPATQISRAGLGKYLKRFS